MAELEEACRDKNIALYVLPPRSPKLNGGVERYNGAWRYDLDACTDLPANVEALNPIIDDWQDTYNFIRPHGALSGSTPAEYLTRPEPPESPVTSQM
jgi:transposase InsO family protein